ncbi:sensor histidine kinase [Dyadobacter arcticus]|uniref:Sensor histidine kinase YesM n=1 Tax=Dyadobacter arcticus TaxID=1078754 RepID=A0ABX0UQR2_9BACT|nr:histidine kinase [Dyadobacter arcticus]NIJ54449.1 sensor histidine kinase YesM [Dyadobacter arcticus]
MKRLFKIVFPGIYGLINYFTIRLLQDIGSSFHFWQRPVLTTSLELGISIITGYVVVFGVSRICDYTDRHRVAGEADSASLGKELLMVVAMSVIVANGILLPFTALTDDGLSMNDMATINTIPLLYTLIYYGIIRSRTYLKGYVQHRLLSEKLANENLQTELRFLKAQYHPHFLFNALNTIYFQIDDDVPGAKQSIELLSELLRYQLYDRQQKVTMREELAYLQNYILLHKVRTSKKMKLKTEFDPTLSDQQVYPLLFLPLVENAFKYVGGNYGITIAATSSSDGITFRVENDLPELDHARAEKGGIGIENLKRRLELLYPGRHHLLLEKQSDHFTAELELIF